MLCHVLAEEGDRLWLAFRRPVDEADGARLTSHFVICAGDKAILVDPGGAADFGPLLAAVSEKVDLDKFSAIILTQVSAHAAGSVGLWAEVLGHDTPVYAAEIAVPDLLHTDPDLNLQPIPENGGEVPMPDGSGLHVIPSQYLPTAASVTLYDPVARVMYSSDIGTAEGAWASDATPFAESFSMVGHAMNAFHQTWFASASARDEWVTRVRELSIDVLAPRAGPCFEGRNVQHFLNWLLTMDVAMLVTWRSNTNPDEASYAPDLSQHDEDVFDLEEDDIAELSATDDDGLDTDLDTYVEPEPLALPEPEFEPEPEPDPASVYEEETDDDVSRLVDALESDDDIDEDDEDSDDDYEIVYVDEDGNEISPDDIDDEDLIEEEELLEGNDEQRLEFPPGKMFRLITRSDFDGLVCAVLLEELDLINDILFVHPNQMQEGEIEVSMDDISTNLPYTPGIFAAFDHHLSEVKRLGKHYDNHIIDPLAPSAARVVYNYFGAEQRFPDVSIDMMEAVDKGDSAQFSIDEVLDPQGWPLLNFIMDSRTGLGRYRGFRVPNYELMMSLIDYCRRFDIDEILKHPDVAERVDLFMEHMEPAKEQIKRCATVHDNLVVLDYREEESIYVTNRFTVYALFPETNISMHIMWGRAQQNTVFAVGKSIFNRTSNTNIGDLMLTYGGGGHRNAGTCQSDNMLADVVRDALIQRINEDG